MTAEERERRIRDIVAQIYEAGADKGRKPGKREQIVEWGTTMLLALTSAAGLQAGERRPS